MSIMEKIWDEVVGGSPPKNAPMFSPRSMLDRQESSRSGTMSLQDADDSDGTSQWIIAFARLAVNHANELAPSCIFFVASSRLLPAVWQHEEKRGFPSGATPGSVS